MRVYLTLFLIIVWTFLILVPLKVYADERTFTCKPVVAGYPKDGGFYVEEISEESTPMLDVIPINQFLLRGETKDLYFKNNTSRKFESLVPYEKVKDIFEIREIHEWLSSWDEILSLDNFRTYYKTSRTFAFDIEEIYRLFTCIQTTQTINRRLNVLADVCEE